MPDPIVMMTAALLAAVVAWLVSWGTGRIEPVTGREGRAGGGFGGAVGAGLGVLAGAWGLGLVPRVPPREVIDRVLLVLIPAAALAESIPWSRARTVLRGVVAAGAAPVLVQGSSYVADLAGLGPREWSPGLTAALLAGFAASLFTLWTAVARLADRSGRSVAAALAGTVAGAGVAVMLSGYAAGGQLGFPMAAAVGVLALAGGRSAAAGAGVAVVGLFGLLVVGRLFAGLTTLNAVLLFAAPLAMWLPEWAGGWPGPRTRAALRVTLTAIPVVIALTFAQRKFAADAAGPSSSGEPSLNDYSGYGG